MSPDQVLNRPTFESPSRSLTITLTLGFRSVGDIHDPPRYQGESKQPKPPSACHITKLPNESLLAIFSMASQPIYPHKPDGCDVLFKVCRRWRAIALSCAALWNELDVKVSVKQIENLRNVLFRHGGDLKLTVRGHTSLLDPIYTLLSNTTPRWRHLRWEAHAPLVWMFQFIAQASKLTNLEIFLPYTSRREGILERTVVLPCLRNLVVRSTMSSKSNLPTFICPKLTSLALERMMVEQRWWDNLHEVSSPSSCRLFGVGWNFAEEYDHIHRYSYHELTICSNLRSCSNQEENLMTGSPDLSSLTISVPDSPPTPPAVHWRSLTILSVNFPSWGGTSRPREWKSFFNSIPLLRTLSVGTSDLNADQSVNGFSFNAVVAALLFDPASETPRCRHLFNFETDIDYMMENTRLVLKFLRQRSTASTGPIGHAIDDEDTTLGENDWRTCSFSLVARKASAVMWRRISYGEVTALFGATSSYGRGNYGLGERESIA